MTNRWPDRLPLPTIDGYGIRPGEAILRTEMEAGPARQRRRYTQAPSRITVRWVLRREQFALFEAWYRWTAKEGGEWFEIDLKGGLGLLPQEARFTRQFEARIVAGHGDYQAVFVLRADGTLWSCGQNNWGKLGDGTTGNQYRLTPCVGLPADSPIKKVQLGGSSRGASTYVLLKDGRVFGTGYGGQYQLNASASNWSGFNQLAFPAGVGGFTDMWIAGEYAQAYFNADDGACYACGYNGNGQLGVGSTANAYMGKITGRARMLDIGNRAFPAETYTAKRFPVAAPPLRASWETVRDRRRRHAAQPVLSGAGP